MATGEASTLTAARRFHALSDEVRLDILGLLGGGGERCVCELTGALRLGQSLLSFHLKVLKDAGLITHRRQGRWSYYALAAAAFRELQEFLEAVPSSAARPCCRPPAAGIRAPTTVGARRAREELR
jgi:ArsR family transcriptional regulator